MRILSSSEFKPDWIFERDYSLVGYEGLDLDLSDEFPAMAIVEKVDNFKNANKNKTKKLSLKNVSYRELKLQDADAEDNIDYREDENPTSFNDIE